MCCGINSDQDDSKYVQLDLNQVIEQANLIASFSSVVKINSMINLLSGFSDKRYCMLIYDNYKFMID